MLSPNLCGCDMEKLGAPPVTSPKSFEIQMLDGMTMDIAGTGQRLKDAKARTYPGTGVIQIDKEWWAGLTPVQRDAVLAHELAHHDDAQACEPCTDARAGSRLRHLGYSREASIQAMASLVSNRRRSGEWDENAVGNGWDAADVWLEDASDRVEPSALWSYSGSLSPSADKLGEPQTLDGDDGQSIGVPDVDGQSIEDPIVLDDGQSIGSPGPFNPPTKSPPKSTPKAPPPVVVPGKGQTPNHRAMMLGVALIVVAVVIIIKKKG